MPTSKETLTQVYHRVRNFPLSQSSIFRVLISVLTVLFCETGWAQVFTGPISGAVGGAGRAALDPSESALLNPASLAHFTRYYAGIQYGIGDHASEGPFHQYGVMLTDGTPGTLVAGAFSYNRRDSEYSGGGDATQQDFQIAVGGFVSKKVSIGIAGHRLIYQPPVGGEKSVNNMHVGALMIVTPNLGLAATVHDALPVSDEVPIAAGVIPTYALGLNYVFSPQFRLRLDLVRPEKMYDGKTNDGRINIQTGLETFFQENWVFRLGGHWRETADQVYVTSGLGFQGPRLSFDYTFQKDVRAGTGFRHLFDLWLPF